MRHRDHRIERQCPVCGQWDDHPRHVVVTASENGHQLIAEHLDCCLADGCPGEDDAHCVARLAAAGGLRGLDLAEHLKALGPNPHLAPAGA